jgi:pimeloyl-ACP methyl ester carboxylesterase
MMKPSLVAALGAGLALPACGLLICYRRGTNAARARLTAVDRHVVSAEWGAVEYAEQGHGEPVLVVHGIFHNCVRGLLSVRDLVPDRRVIAPSRFGYLGSSMPPNAKPAQQADAFASLLDALDIGQVDVICESVYDIGAATRPAPSRAGEASRCTRWQPAGKSDRRRPTVLREAIEPATPLVGAADFRAIDHGPAGGGTAEGVCHEY